MTGPEAKVRFKRRYSTAVPKSINRNKFEFSTGSSWVSVKRGVRAGVEVGVYLACVADALNILGYTKGLDEWVGRLQRRLGLGLALTLTLILNNPTLTLTLKQHSLKKKKKIDPNRGPDPAPY